MTPAWIVAMSKDERKYVSNGALSAEAHTVEGMLCNYLAVIHHQRKQPQSLTRDTTIAALDAQLELLREEKAQIKTRRDEWHAYVRTCNQTGVDWQTGRQVW